MYSMNIKIFFFLAWKKRGRGSRAGTKEQKQTQKEVKKQEENYESERLAEGESSLRAGSTQTYDLLTQTQRLSEDNLQSKRWLSAILILMFEGTHAPHISECLKSLKSLSNLCPLYEGLHRTMEKSQGYTIQSQEQLTRQIKNVLHGKFVYSYYYIRFPHVSVI